MNTQSRTRTKVKEKENLATVQDFLDTATIEEPEEKLSMGGRVSIGPRVSMSSGKVEMGQLSMPAVEESEKISMSPRVEMSPRVSLSSDGVLSMSSDGELSMSGGYGLGSPLDRSPTRAPNRLLQQMGLSRLLGRSQFGETQKLPEEDTCLKALRYFRRLADWNVGYQLTPSGVTEVQDRPGVYMLFVRTPDRGRSHLSPIGYIGMSYNVRGRLSGYAAATNPDRPPVYQVVRDRILNDPELAHKYLTASPTAMRAMRRQWMRERGLRFYVAYTRTEQEAKELEATMIRYCDTHDIELWNTIKYSTGVTWPQS